MSDAPADAKERASIFLTAVTQKLPVFGLRNDGGGLATWRFDDSGETLIPFWSDKETAGKCAETNFPDYQVFEMTSQYFTESVLPQLQTQNILVGVNLSDKMGGVDLPANDLLQEIKGG
jgi:hypothetical protein